MVCDMMRQGVRLRHLPHLRPYVRKVTQNCYHTRLEYETRKVLYGSEPKDGSVQNSAYMAICLSHARTSRGLPLSHPVPCIPALHIRVLGAAAVNAACGVWGDYRFRLPNSAFFLAFAAAAESRHAAQMDMPPLAAAALAAALAPACPSEQRACSQRRRGTRQGRRQSWVSEAIIAPNTTSGVYRRRAEHTYMACGYSTGNRVG